jgi:hypothetical protein
MGSVELLIAWGVLVALVSGAHAPPAANLPGQSLQIGESGAQLAASAACQGILADWNVSSALFLEVCNESSFQSAYEQQGVQHFFAGYSEGHGFEVDYYGFEWEATCHNSSWAGQQCGEQEYWAANLTSNTTSGPFFQESPPICDCPSQGFPYTPVGLLIPGAIGVTSAGIILLAVMRRRRNRGRARAPTPDPLPPRGPSS